MVLVRALRLLRPTEVPARPCRVPRDAKVFMAALALVPAVEAAAETVGGKRGTNKLPHGGLVHV